MARNGTNRFCFLPFSTWALIVSDTLALLAALVCALLVRLALPGGVSFWFYLGMAPAFCCFPFIYALQRLYPGLQYSPAEELKSLTIGTSGGFLLLMALVFLLKSADSFSRLFFMLNAFFAIAFVPLGRHLIRLRFYAKPWWKKPVIAIATAEGLHQLKLNAGRSRFLGLSLVAHLLPVFSGDASLADEKWKHLIQDACPEDPEGVGQDALDPAEKTERLTLTSGADLGGLFASLSSRHPHAQVLFHLADIPDAAREGILDSVGLYFSQVLVIPESSWLWCVPSQVVHLPAGFGLVLRKNLADETRLKAKRVLDLILSIFFSVVGLPLLALLSLAVALDSPGGVFYRQTRIGRKGKPFTVFKFRTMARDSDTILREYLASHPEASAEWQATQKLKNDPRVTRVGRFLRKTSLDELPQIINVFRGEMSLVGPRPIVEAEKSKYAGQYTLYTRVLPGITGLWQVSGRNDITYEERVALDTYYISNWSVWLDIYILLRTIPEVLRQRGAY